MRGKEIALSFFLVLLMISSALYIFSGNEEPSTSTNSIVFDSEDPLFQHEGHDHSNASQHMVGTDNFEQLTFTLTDLSQAIKAKISNPLGFQNA